MKKTTLFKNLAKTFITFRKKQIRCSYFPIKLWIETTSRCNLSCSACINREIDPANKGDMDMSLFKNIIDQAKNHVFEANLFHRGEPLLHPDIFEMISYAENNGIRTCIHTNASLLDKETGKKLIEAGLSKIFFSLDTYIKDEYEKNRQGADFERTVSNITDFLKMKKEMKSGKPTTTILLMDICHGSNNKNFVEKIFSKKTSAGLSLNKKTNGWRHKADHGGSNNFKIFKSRFRQLPLDQILTRKMHNWGGSLDTEQSGTGPAKGPDTYPHVISCTFPWYSLTVFYNGEVFMCPQDFKGVYQVGNLYKNSLAEIFNGIPIQAARNNFKNKDISKINPCSSCDRLGRKTAAGIPVEYLKSFLKDLFSVFFY